MQQREYPVQQTEARLLILLADAAEARGGRIRASNTMRRRRTYGWGQVARGLTPSRSSCLFTVGRLSRCHFVRLLGEGVLEETR